MPWNKDGSRKSAYPKKSGFKMKGWSAFTYSIGVPPGYWQDEYGRPGEKIPLRVRDALAKKFGKN